MHLPKARSTQVLVVAGLIAIAGAAAAIAVQPSQASRPGQQRVSAAASHELARKERRLAMSSPDVAVIAAFQRPARPTDALPGQAASVLQSFNQAEVADALRAGAPNAASSRRVLHDVGKRGNLDLFLVPTDRSTICMVWVPDVLGGGCTPGFGPSSHSVVQTTVINGTTYVFGLLKDDVTAVTYVQDGLKQNAEFSTDGAFIIQTDGVPEDISATLADGSSVAVGWAGAPPRLVK